MPRHANRLRWQLFSQPHCTEVGLADTLEDLGHIVVRVQEQAALAGPLMREVRQSDLFLFTRTWNTLVTLEHLAEMRRLGVPSASYHLDLYVGLQREADMVGDPFWSTDFVFSPDGDPESAKVFESYGINHHYIKPGVYKGGCYKAEPDSSLAHDVVFVGTGVEYGHPEWPYRAQLVSWLQSTFGHRFGKYGHPQRPMRNDDLNRLYASAKVAVGDSLCLGFIKPYYWSDRVYETLGRGGFIIHPYIVGMGQEFTDGDNIAFYDYGDWDNLRESIDYYVEHDAERAVIRDRGHEFVKANATYHNRLAQALSIIEAS